MPTPTRSLASAIVATLFCCTCATALAMPKAAEDETAQVSSGANAARPQHSSAKPQAAASKAKTAKQSVKSAKPNSSPKKSKTGSKTARTKK